MSSKGVLTIAHSNLKYARQAITLARSIRLRDADLRLAIATDFPAAYFAGLYDEIIPWDFSAWPGLVCKLELYQITPFDITLFVETDCLVVQSLYKVFDYFAGQEFAVFGKNRSEVVWFRTPKCKQAVQAAVPSATYPVFNGGVYYFTKSAMAAGVFERARALRPRYDELHLIRMPSGGENEEPLLSLAMAQADLKATDDPQLDVLAVPEEPRYQIQINVLAGECELIREGRLAKPVIAHFVWKRDGCYEYRREALRLAVAYRGPFFPYYGDSMIRLTAYGQWFLTQKVPEPLEKLRRFWRRHGHKVRQRTRLRTRLRTHLRRLLP